MTGSQATRRHRSLVSKEGLRLNSWKLVAFVVLIGSCRWKNVAVLCPPVLSFVPFFFVKAQLSVFSPSLCSVFTSDLILVRGIFIPLTIGRVLKYFWGTSSAHAAEQQVRRSDRLAGAQRAFKTLVQLIVLIGVAATAIRGSACWQHNSWSFSRRVQIVFQMNSK